ncbi:mitochondrial genome maintenance MGM101-domain-containing protein [Cantharellus anzutake]|uniref:mitochondrial genome maintenance MGM101-domain-containing protein n=1 Tax=Cantharellus anzutake TaxID=1750568 RepID=UPI001908BD94|nr:mitochondrial genome maintenance MGM101-domain-containing protein [Cantharellus anzutake]KAF8316978.1 mitochondrial genome maintenance MGM101-domain-containing protein [Cantharellus anzutake]
MAGRGSVKSALRLFYTPAISRTVRVRAARARPASVSYHLSTPLRQYVSNGVNGANGTQATGDVSPTTDGVSPPPSETNATGESASPAFSDSLPAPDGNGTNWSTSYHGLSVEPFPPEAAEILMAPIDPLDIEMKPDGLIYLPEIKYRRILNKAFGPGGWGLAPRGPTHVGPKVVSREYALVCLGRLVAVARGEQEYFDKNGIPTATEACKSNALMRCCKDLGVASELWDPRFIRDFKAKHCVEVFVEHIPTKRKRKLWRRRDAKFDYPYKE